MYVARNTAEFTRDCSAGGYQDFYFFYLRIEPSKQFMVNRATQQISLFNSTRNEKLLFVVKLNTNKNFVALAQQEGQR